MTAPLSIDAATAAADRALFPGFRPFRQAVNGVEIAGVIGGSGPPLLLLHGHPQSHVIWHKVARELVRDYTVVATDLRGYGASSKPAGSASHVEYSKRAMAQDQVDVMRALGFERFQLCAHDRGARVAHRLCVDHPERVERAMLLDIAPTLAMYEQTDMAFASAYWHWFFLIQRWPPTPPPCASRPACMQCARTTARRPPSTWSTIARIAQQAGASRRRCVCCGASMA
jgi:haloacetate dehalogenase